MLKDKELELIGLYGEEYGVTTGRKRIVNYLNLNKLIESINLSGTNHIIISKTDILQKCHIYKYYYNSVLNTFENLDDMKNTINSHINSLCEVSSITYSNSPENIDL